MVAFVPIASITPHQMKGLDKMTKKQSRESKPKYYQAIIPGEYFGTIANSEINFLKYRLLTPDTIIVRGKIQLTHTEKVLARLDEISLYDDVLFIGFVGCDIVPLILKKPGNIFLKTPDFEKYHGRELVINTVFSI